MASADSTDEASRSGASDVPSKQQLLDPMPQSDIPPKLGDRAYHSSLSSGEFGYNYTAAAVLRDPQFREAYREFEERVRLKLTRQNNRPLNRVKRWWKRWLSDLSS